MGVKRNYLLGVTLLAAGFATVAFLALSPEGLDASTSVGQTDIQNKNLDSGEKIILAEKKKRPGFDRDDVLRGSIRDSIKDEIKQELRQQIRRDAILEIQEQLTENILIPRVVESGVGNPQTILGYSGTTTGF